MSDIDRINSFAERLVDELAREKALQGLDAIEALLWMTHSADEIAVLFEQKAAYAWEYAKFKPLPAKPE